MKDLILKQFTLDLYPLFKTDTDPKKILMFINDANKYVNNSNERLNIIKGKNKLSINLV